MNLVKHIKDETDLQSILLLLLSPYAGALSKATLTPSVIRIWWNCNFNAHYVFWTHFCYIPNPHRYKGGRSWKLVLGLLILSHLVSVRHHFLLRVLEHDFKPFRPHLQRIWDHECGKRQRYFQ